MCCPAPAAELPTELLQLQLNVALHFNHTHNLLCTALPIKSPPPTPILKAKTRIHPPRWVVNSLLEATSKCRRYPLGSAKHEQSDKRTGTATPSRSKTLWRTSTMPSSTPTLVRCKWIITHAHAHEFANKHTQRSSLPHQRPISPSHAKPPARVSKSQPKTFTTSPAVPSRGKPRLKRSRTSASLGH